MSSIKRSHLSIWKEFMRIALFYVCLPLLLFACNNSDLTEKTGLLNDPYLEWEISWDGSEDNPYDVVASARFTHSESGEQKRSLMFYDGDGAWKFRFTGTRTGIWQIQTEGPRPLGNLTGKVRINSTDQAYKGFFSGRGTNWVWNGTDEAFVPQFAMMSGPEKYWSSGRVDTAAVKETVWEFIIETGFTGLHFSGGGGWWFNIFDKNTRDDHGNPIGEQDPDQRTFNVMEEFLTRAYEQGAATHIWMWGSDGWGEEGPEGIGGPMSVTDKRILRYIAGRLGPIPGWSMGYGYDLHAWADADELRTWYEYLKDQLGGWEHMLGARSDPYDANNQEMKRWMEEGIPLQRKPLSAIYWSGDYVGHYDYRVAYPWYVEVISSSDKPQLQEDRFRIRKSGTFQPKDYTPDMTVRGLWHSTMAGGVGNIWGNLLPHNENNLGSDPYDNRAEATIRGTRVLVDIKGAIQTYHTFWFEKDLFTTDLIRDNDLTGNNPGEGVLEAENISPVQVCLRDSDYNRFIFYAEQTKSIRMDLRSMPRALEAVAVDTRQSYKEYQLGTLDPQLYSSAELPYESDWVIAIGDRMLEGE
ncbi:MAG: DUF5060 domain-containing protein [Candidatus Marinimicrobia bacterium]|nr:DUF5060 domain-containing protein [Candidatus Neomarinimicrobiota bacterium]